LAATEGPLVISWAARSSAKAVDQEAVDEQIAGARVLAAMCTAAGAIMAAYVSVSAATPVPVGSSAVDIERA
jgi:hypothetical protein